MTLRTRQPTLRSKPQLRSFSTGRKSTETVYGSVRWKDLRNLVVRERGSRCEECGAGGKLYVDHVVELKDGGAPFDRRNLRVLCASCHGIKTVAENARRLHERPSIGDLVRPRDLARSKIPITLVAGPPASGKSTFVRRNTQPGELVIDLDDIATRLTGEPQHSRAAMLAFDAAMSERNDVLRSLSESPRWAAAWLILTEPTPEGRDWWRDHLGVSRVVVLATDADECWARIRADAGRAETREDASAAVSRWWSLYRPGDDEEEVR